MRCKKIRYICSKYIIGEPSKWNWIHSCITRGDHSRHTKVQQHCGWKSLTYTTKQVAQLYDQEIKKKKSSPLSCVGWALKRVEMLKSVSALMYDQLLRWGGLLASTGEKSNYTLLPAGDISDVFVWLRRSTHHPDPRTKWRSTHTRFQMMSTHTHDRVDGTDNLRITILAVFL